MNAKSELYIVVNNIKARLPGGVRPARLALLLLLLLFLVYLSASSAWTTRESRPVPSSGESDLALVLDGPEASREQVERTCGTCHAYPPPEIFPKSRWPHEVDRGYHFLREASVPSEPPSFASVVAYYQRRAPNRFQCLNRRSRPAKALCDFERTGYRPSRGLLSPGVANVRFVHLSDERKLDVLACDMMNGKVFLLKPYEPAAELRVVTDAVPHPAHAEVVDLNGDGIKDLLIADLGSRTATDDRVGSVVWLKGEATDRSRRSLWLAGLAASPTSRPRTSTATEISTWLLPSSDGSKPDGSSCWKTARPTPAERSSFPRRSTHATAQFTCR